MIPLKDDLHPQRVPYITWLLLALNSLVFILQLGLPQRLIAQLYYLFGIVPAALVFPEQAGIPAGSWLTLLTSMFLHGGWLHFLANSWTLWLFGDDVEDRLGHVNFLVLYFASGLIAGLTHIFFSPTSLVPTIGASGAIAGVMGAFLLLYPRARIHILVPIFFFIDIWKVPAALYLPFWFLGELFSGTVALLAPGFAGIAFWAHVGGFIGGILVLYYLRQFEIPQRARTKPQVLRGPGFVIIQNDYSNHRL